MLFRWNNFLESINKINTSNIVTKQYPNFLLIIGNKSSDMFDFFGVEELHGLKKSECYDNSDNAYIAGFCNQYPDNPKKIYLFLNKFRLGNGYKDVLLIMHETLHLSLEIHGHNLEDGELEEKVITWAEETADEIYNFVRNI